MYVLHFSGDTVKLLEGKAGSRGIVINSLYSTQMPCEYLDAPDDKGYEKIEAVVINALRDLGEELKNKKVKIILDNINISFREMVVPTLNRKKTIDLIKNEIFSDERLAENNTVDYIVVENKVDGQKQSRIFVKYVDNEIIKCMDKLAKNLLCKLESIDIGQNCTAKHLKYNRDYLPDTFMFVELRDSVINISYIIDGEFKSSMAKSALILQSTKFANDHTYYANDISNTVRTANDLFLRQFPDVACSDIVLAGTRDKVGAIQYVLQDKLGMRVSVMTPPDNVDDISEDDYGEFFCTIGGLITNTTLAI